MKTKYWICAQFKVNGKFSHFHSGTLSWSRKSSIDELLKESKSIDWKEFKKYGWKCIHVIVQPVEKEEQ